MKGKEIFSIHIKLHVGIKNMDSKLDFEKEKSEPLVHKIEAQKGKGSCLNITRSRGDHIPRVC